MQFFSALEKFIRTYRYYFNPRSYRFYQQIAYERDFNPKNHDLKNNKIVVFDFKHLEADGVMGRRAYLFYTYFSKAGYTVFIKKDFRFLASMLSKKYKFLLLNHPFLILKKYSMIRGNYIVLTDYDPVGLTNRCQRFIRLRYDRDYQSTSSNMVMPFCLHPIIYHKGWDGQIPWLAKQKKHWRLFFSGNYCKKKYDKRRFKTTYDLLSRFQILQALNQNLDEKHIRLIKSKDYLNRHDQDFYNGFILVDTEAINLNGLEWLLSLARSDFFLACPGVDMPLCHNMVEAMAVGTIPVIEYPHYLVPPLEHMVNCVAFQGQRDLLDQVQALFQMDEATIAGLRKGVIEYYQNHLSIAGFFKKLDLLQGEEIELYPEAYKMPRKCPHRP